MKIQGLGGDIIGIASKNGVVSGPNNIGYGSPRLNSDSTFNRTGKVQLGECGQSDGVIIGSKIWEGEWAEEELKPMG